MCRVVSAGRVACGRSVRGGRGRRRSGPGRAQPGRLRPAVVDVGVGVQAEPAVAVLVVVPGEEFLAVRPGGLDRGEPGGERGPVFSVLNWASE
jgi:hypothetical protein